MSRVLLFLAFFSFFGLSLAQAQTRQLTGTVKDKTDGQPLVGVSVNVKDSKTGASTDANGTYKITIPANGATVTFTYVGYKTKNVNITNQTKVDVSLEEDANNLQEVTVNVGYGTVSRDKLSSAVSSVTAKDLADFPVSTAAQALAGKLAGVSVTTTEGSPGAEIEVKVRGGGSLTQSNAPLYIVDGVQLDNALSLLSPNEIQSIDVLKDIASTAIYGARAANGVVIITTKGGKEMKTTVSFDAYAGARQIVNELSVMNPYDYVSYQYQLYNYNTSQDVKDAFAKRYGTFEDLDIYKNIQNIDWQDKVFGRQAFSNTQVVNLAGGTKTTTFNFTANNTQEDGIMLNSGYRRTFASLRFDHKISDKFRTGINLRYSRQRIDGVGTTSTGSQGNNRLRNSVRYQPYNGAGDSGDQFDADYGATLLTNPITLANQELKYDYRNDFISSAYLSYQILKNLSFKSTLGLNFTDRKTNTFNGPLSGVARNSAGLPVVVLANSNTTTLTNSNTLNYRPNLGGKNELDILIGQEINQSDNKQNSTTVKYFPVNITAEEAFGNIQKATPGTGQVQDAPTTGVSGFRLFSYFGRATYTFDNKYILTALVRRDGSSLFAANNRWGTFPSAQFAWRASEEGFIKNAQLNWLDNLKIRASYGSAGNNRIDPDLYKTLFYTNSVSAGYAASDASITPGLATTALANPLLKWETTISLNFGVDFSLFKNRLSGSIDVYQNHVKNLILNADIPSILGNAFQLQNVGSTQNRGLEFQLTGLIAKTKDFTYNSSFNIAFNRNKVLGLASGVTAVKAASGWVNSLDDFYVEVGKPVGQFYGYVSNGFYTLDDFDRSTYESTNKWVLKPGVTDNAAIIGKATVVPGDMKLLKTTNSSSNVITVDDRTVLGNAQPKFTGGLNQQFAYKGFDLSIFVNFSVGGKEYNANKIEFTSQYNVKDNNLLSTMNDRWKWYNTNGALITNWDQLAAANADTKIWTPVTNNYFLTSYSIEDASYLRITNVTLGYSLPQKLLARTKVINKVRFYATVNNLYTITGYTGYDPEASTRRSNPLTPGVDYAAYPRSRYILAGLNVTF